MNPRNLPRPAQLPTLAIGFGAAVFVLWSVSAEAGNASVDKTGVKKPEKSSASGSRHIYYPDTARSFFDYQDTGAFAGRPMVIPPTLPIISQPTHLVIHMPAPDPVKAPLPTLAPQSAAAPKPVASAAPPAAPKPVAPAAPKPVAPAAPKPVASAAPPEASREPAAAIPSVPRRPVEVEPPVRPLPVSRD
ncbi:hypothetical protein SIID45300_03320 [Candidatus Magnetaquicoccaceae bacterium FCR-1]|uniref:Secreted protein n=1 Tax=Candidatus Magnetaquiglobus chichijimensis TaxID=3141448 RepID=A0ABQ0CDM7_9PROT